jgi:hypothetical protein
MSASHDRRGARDSNGPRLLYASYWALLGTLVAAFEAKLGISWYWSIGGLLIVNSLLLYAVRPIYALCSLPGPLMLGVIARVPGLGAGIHLGDVHLFAIVSMFLATPRARQSIFIGRLGLVSLAVLLITASWLLSVDTSASTIAVLALSELALVYVLTLNVVSDSDGATVLLRAWCGAITLCSALVIVSYFRGEPLILDSDAAFVSGFEALKVSANTFVRASYFVTSFNFPLAATLVMLLISSLSSYASVQGRALAFGALIVNAVAAALLANKSVIGAVAITTVVLCMYLVRSKRFWLSLCVSAVLAAGAVKVAVLLADQVVSTNQLALFADRFGNGDSFVLRLDTWQRVINAVLGSPHALLIGMGPDASTRSHDSFFSSIFRIQHGVDNDYLFILLNYGIIILILYVRYFVRALRLLAGLLSRDPDVVLLPVMGCIVSWLVVGVAQQGGAAKTMALIVQVAALVELIRCGKLRVGQPPAIAGEG